MLWISAVLGIVFLSLFAARVHRTAVIYWLSFVGTWLVLSLLLLAVVNLAPPGSMLLFWLQYAALALPALAAFYLLLYAYALRRRGCEKREARAAVVSAGLSALFLPVMTGLLALASGLDPAAMDKTDQFFSSVACFAGGAE